MIHRRTLLATTGALALPTFAIVERANAQSAFDWKQAKGASIEVNFAKSPRGDVLQAPPDEGEYHLIVCRNVVIYFEREAQEKLFRDLHRALAPGGFLVLGKVETLLGDVRSMFTPVNARERIFRKA